MTEKDMQREITGQEINSLYVKIKKDAQSSGYHLNPDEQFSKDLVKGLLINQARYGYQACPCRLSSGSIENDRDIVCPCDYRDADINDFGACYCGLYVDQDIFSGLKELKPIPERRYKQSTASEKDSTVAKTETILVNKESSAEMLKTNKIPVWRCRVCGYLCARENPPEVCPICKVKKDRFERFI
ncbi:MAG: ferredoxin:glutaredoxin reductase [Actinobacteria bacterium]|nr:ferredoxin:glutaredoxin reductase [Actinomycetota bacterium]